MKIEFSPNEWQMFKDFLVQNIGEEVSLVALILYEIYMKHFIYTIPKTNKRQRVVVKLTSVQAYAIFDLLGNTNDFTFSWLYTKLHEYFFKEKKYKIS